MPRIRPHAISWFSALFVAALSISCGREPTVGANAGVASFTIPFANQTASGGGDDVSSVSLTLYAINPSAPAQSDRKKELRSYRFSRDTRTNAWTPKGVNDPDDDSSPVTITIDFPIIDGTTYQLEGTASNSAGVALFAIEPATFTDKQASGTGGSVTVQTTVTYIGPGASASSITLTPSPLRLGPSQTGSFTATVKDAAGNTVTNAPLRYRSSNNQIAFFQDDRVGTVTSGITAGTATITAGIEGLSVTGSAQVIVSLTPTSIALVSGGGQTGQAGAQLANPIVVRVLAGTVPVPGVTVGFSVASGSLSASTATTDASGAAQVRWTLGSTVGSQTLTVSTAGLSNLAVTATATAPPKTVSILSVSSLSITTTTSATVTAEVRTSGSPTGGDVVTFSSSVGGSFSPATATANTNGQASSVFTSSTPGSYTVTASINGSTSAVVTIVVAQSTVVTQLVKVQGDGQNVLAGSTMSPMIVRALNGVGAAVEGVAIEWVIGSTVLSTVSTDANGLVAVQFTAPLGTGTGSITARVKSTPSLTATFSYLVIAP